MKTATTLALLAGMGSGALAQDFLGAEVYSKAKVKYGRWEMRMRMAKLSGTVSSFFTYYPDSYVGGTTPWREIDIEYLGNKATGFQSNIITGAAGNQTTSEKFMTTSGDPGAGFHDYVLEWTPDTVRWSFDGKVLRTTTAANSDQVTDLQDSSQTFRMNLWASTSASWVGAFDSASLPAYQVIKSIRYSSYTPGAGTDGTDFTPSWTDSFATFNSSRWAKGDWTFDGNYVTFAASNAVVKDGHLVLCLTRGDAAGLVGDFPHDTDTVATGLAAGTSSSARLSLQASREGLRVGIPQGLGRWNLAVFDLAGRLLTSRKGSGSSNLELALPGKGIRIVKVQGEHGILEGRIVQ